VNRWNCS